MALSDVTLASTNPTSLRITTSRFRRRALCAFSFRFGSGSGFRNDALRTHLCGKQQRGPAGPRIGDTFSGNVIGAAMRRSQKRHRKAAEKRYALIEPDQLHRDLTLIVIHRQHSIEL